VISRQNLAVLINHAGHTPTVHPNAYVAPTAVLSGDVHVGSDARILFGAVLSNEGGSVEVGPGCVIMENAVLRGTARHPTRLGREVLVGPHAYISGAILDDHVFVATGAMVFNGAVHGAASSLALGATAHIGCRVPAETRIPIGWVAVGDPARLYPPDRVDEIREGLEEAGGFLPFVFRTEPGLLRADAMHTAMTRYSLALGTHESDVIGELGPT
jgi:carbonic anhydrase/acetyltransferase-like protein (isoleucine patch superfamily)